MAPSPRRWRNEVSINLIKTKMKNHMLCCHVRTLRACNCNALPTLQLLSLVALWCFRCGKRSIYRRCWTEVEFIFVFLINVTRSLKESTSHTRYEVNWREKYVKLVKNCNFASYFDLSVPNYEWAWKGCVIWYSLVRYWKLFSPFNDNPIHFHLQRMHAAHEFITIFA